MTDFDSRFRALVADHRRIQDDYNALRDAGHEPADFDNPEPIWREWFDRFTEVKDRMYRLAYDLGIPFEAGDATADDYAQVWVAVQALLGQDGNRRRGNKKTCSRVLEGVTSESLADVATSNK